MLLKYYGEYQKCQLVIPQKIQKQLKQYKTKVDDIQQFIDDNLVADNSSRVHWCDVLDAYNQYLNLNIKTNSKESKELKQKLIKKVFKVDYKKLLIGKINTWGWQGYKLLIEDFVSKDNNVSISRNKSSVDLIINVNKNKSSSIVIESKKERKKIKQRIPQVLRGDVWRIYMGKLESPCLVCDNHLLSFSNFVCGHVDANGPTNIGNLRPICGPCNKSMGRDHMKEFAEKY